MTLPRISRPCYDKPHRCPGWAGGGMRSARRDRCENGSIRVRPRGDEATDEDFYGHPGTYPFRFGRCTVCAVVTLPYATRWADPRWLFWKVRWEVSNKVDDLRWRLHDRLDRD